MSMSLHLTGVIGFLGVPLMGWSRRHVAAISLAVAMSICFEAEHDTRGTNTIYQPNKFPFLKIFCNIYQIFAVK